jgi:hypothetical protein
MWPPIIPVFQLTPNHSIDKVNATQFGLDHQVSLFTKSLATVFNPSAKIPSRLASEGKANLGT